MKKFFSSVFLVVFLCGNAFATTISLVPFTPVISNSLSVLAPGSTYSSVGVYYFTNPSSYPPKVDSIGNISKPSAVQWVNASDLSSPDASVQKKDISAQMSFDKVKLIGNRFDLAGDLPLYPKVYAALNTPALESYATVSVGGVFMDNNQIPRTCTSRDNYVMGDGAAFTEWYGDHVTSFPGSVYPERAPYLHVYFDPSVVAIVPVEPTSASQFASLTAMSDGTATPAYRAEMDKMFQDPSYVPTFTDDTTGLPYAPPVGAASKAQVDQYNKDGTATATGAASGVAAGAAVGSAQGAVNAAQGAVGTAQGNLAANPGDVGLQQKLANAQTGLANAQGTLDALKAQQAKADADNAKNAAISAPAVGDAYGDSETRDFSARMSTFMTTMKSSSMFSLPSQMLGSIPTGGTSVFNVSFGRFGSTVFDLASLGSAIALIRILVLFVFSVTSLKIITLKGGSG